jgi:energy-coupling factor transporter ATP-binding protein EcfA2
MEVNEFKLPIEYINHDKVNEHVIHDLELVQSEETPVYEKVFLPKTVESKEMSHKWANYYTTDTRFLEESVLLFKKAQKTGSIAPFRSHWKKIQENKEFKITYQYIESSWLSILNTSPSFLMFISLYFMTSPLLFIASPVIMMIIPFVLLRLKGETFSWETYKVIFKSLVNQHAIGALFTKFNTGDPKQQAYLVGSALFFCVQLYTNVYAFYTFYMNMHTIHTVFQEMNRYLEMTIHSMESLQEWACPLSSYTHFCRDLELQKQILVSFYKKSSLLKGAFQQCGTSRSIFYELYANTELKCAIEYSFGMHGFLQNIFQLKQSIGKKLNTCTFSNKTSFNKAYYPTKNPIKNSYTLDANMIITGPNASGKTTILKATIINILLSQQVGCGFYKSACVKPYESIYCYINIPDTSGRDSLFQAEARRCKEILDESEKGKHTLCIFDELFSGTNPQEATASACSLLLFLNKNPSFRFLLTTHFIDVCKELSTTSIVMKRMKTVNEISTYKLENGISYARGGVNVLQQLHFPESIVNDARMRSK